MSLLNQNDWEEVCLGDLASEIKSRIANPEKSKLDRFVGLENLTGGELTVRDWSSTDGLVSAAKEFKKGDTLFARRNVYLKRASITSFDGVCSGDAFVLREDDLKIIPGFLPIILNSQSLWNYASANADGTMSKRVKWRDLSGYKLKLPSKGLQKEIARAIWSCDEALYSNIKLLECLQIAMQSVFKEALVREKSENMVPVEQLLKEPPKNGISPKCNSEEKGYKTVSLSAISGGKFVVDGNVKYAEVSREVPEKYDVLTDDVFIVRGNGNKNLCGKAGISEHDYNGLFYPDLLIRLRFDAAKILPKFASIQWNMARVHGQLIRGAKSTNGIWKVNGDDIKRHKLVAPSLDLQEKVLEQTNSIEARYRLCLNQIEHNKKLLAALINFFF